MNLPNFLTILRLLLTGVFVFFLTKHGYASMLIATGLFALASGTDFFDGYYAKKYNLVSNFGKIMDPIADKFLILTAFFIFVQMGIVAGWMFYLIFIREIFVTGSRLIAMRQGKVIAAERAGKLKTVIQLLAIMVILVFLTIREMGRTAHWDTHIANGWICAITILMWITVGLTVVSGISYFWNNRKILHA